MLCSDASRLSKKEMAMNFRCDLQGSKEAHKEEMSKRRVSSTDGLDLTTGSSD